MSKKCGLVLEGGGGKGAYQMGALLALRFAGKHFDTISGSSVGALNGFLVASGQLVAARLGRRPHEPWMPRHSRRYCSGHGNALRVKVNASGHFQAQEASRHPEANSQGEATTKRGRFGPNGDPEGALDIIAADDLLRTSLHSRSTECAYRVGRAR